MAATTTARRPTAQDFLELVERGKRGRLELYTDFAAGAGKTWTTRGWRRAVRRSVRQRLVDEGFGLDLHLVSFESEEDSP